MFLNPGDWCRCGEIALGSANLLFLIKDGTAEVRPEVERGGARRRQVGANCSLHSELEGRTVPWLAGEEPPGFVQRAGDGTRSPRREGEDPERAGGRTARWPQEPSSDSRLWIQRESSQRTCLLFPGLAPPHGRSYGNDTGVDQSWAVDPHRCASGRRQLCVSVTGAADLGVGGQWVREGTEVGVAVCRSGWV